jgi:heat shock protein HtpX
LGGRFAGARNLLKAWLLVAAGCLALGAIGWGLGGYRPASILVFCVLLAAAGFYWYADRVVLGMLGARELPVAQSPVLHSAVERLAARAGVAKPRLYLLPHGFPLSLAAGRGPRGSAVALSAGLLGAAPPAELEGIVAHEIAHVRSRDVIVQTSVVVLAVMIVESSRIGGFLTRALLFVLAPIAAAFVHALLSAKRELDADRTAAWLCESPHGLADALLRVDQASDLIEFGANPATEPLYPVNPFAEEGIAAMFVTHPPLAESVARLRALDPEWKEKLRAA